MTKVTKSHHYCSHDYSNLHLSAQARMEEVLRGLDSVECYIDDIGVFNTSWEHHIEVLGDVLQCLEENGFTINPLKCE